MKSKKTHVFIGCNFAAMNSKNIYLSISVGADFYKVPSINMLKFMGIFMGFGVGPTSTWCAVLILCKEFVSQKV